MHRASNLILIGPMGAGKTTIGRHLAEYLDLPFVDLDHEIEAHTGATIPLIFELEGETGFRQRESQVLAQVLRRDGILLATGGGAILGEGNRQLLRERGFVVWLDTPVPVQLDRLAREHHKRPLLQTPDRRQKLEDLASVRNPLYRATAHLVVASTGRHHGAGTTRHLADLLPEHWDRVLRSQPVPMSAPIHVDVRLGERSYPIDIGPGLLAQPALWRSAIAGRHALVVSNTTVAPLYLERVLAGLEGLNVATHIIDDGEQYKSLDQASGIFAALAAMGASRDATIIALGGGVIGDLAGFAAACWMRGVHFMQMPTTLLAMVDSSVGGKTGVNLAAGKNLVGAFHQPRAVVIDTDTLATLPEREYRAGLAEVVKYGALGDVAFFDWLEINAAALKAREPAAIAEAIAASCRHKAGVVARDEREDGERALLNLGHTFGHALEAEAGYGLLLHGEAVAIGMVLAARLSTHLGRAKAADADRLSNLLEACGLPTALPAGHDIGRLIARMRLDKKNLSGHLRLILWRGIGRADMVPDVDEADIAAVLAA